MKMTREQMIDEVIRSYGFENNTTLTFCEIAEKWESDFAVEQMFIVAMSCGYEIEEEEEEE